MKKLAIWAIFLSSLLPLIIAPNLVTLSVGGKTTFIRGLAFLVMGLTTLSVFSERQKENRIILLNRIILVFKNPLFIAITINVALLAISTVFAFDRSFAFFGEPFRAEGFLTIFAFFVLCFGMLINFAKKDWDRYFLLTTLVGVIVLIIEFWQVLNGSDRPDSLTGNPSFLSGYLLFVALGAICVFIKGHREIKKSYVYFGITTFIFSVLGIFLTLTRGTIVAISSSLIFVLIIAFVKGEKVILNSSFKFFSINKSLRFVAGTLLAFIIIFGGVFISTRQSSFWQKVPGLNRLATTSIGEGTSASRIKFAKISVNGFFKDSNIKTIMLGTGWDNFVFFFQDHYDPQIYRYEEKLADRAHNKLVDVLVMSGLLGLISYLIVWFLLFKYGFRLMSKKLSIGLASIFFLTAFFVNNLFAFDVAVTYLGFYSIVAFLVFVNIEKQNENQY